MLRLTLLMFTLTSPVLMGSLIVVALAAGFDDLRGILVAAGAGFVLAVPAAIVIARRLKGL